MVQLGGHAVYLAAQRDRARHARVRAATSRATSRAGSTCIDGARLRAPDRRRARPRTRRVPVINGLSDLHHPCQAWPTSSRCASGGSTSTRLKRRLGRRRQQHVPLDAAARRAARRRAASSRCPPGYEPDPRCVAEACRARGGRVTVTTRAARGGARAPTSIYTDVWTSMGQEAEREQRLRGVRAATR